MLPSSAERCQRDGKGHAPCHPVPSTVCKSLVVKGRAASPLQAPLGLYTTGISESISQSINIFSCLRFIFMQLTQESTQLRKLPESLSTAPTQGQGCSQHHGSARAQPKTQGSCLGTEESRKPQKLLSETIRNPNHPSVRGGITALSSFFLQFLILSPK